MLNDQINCHNLEAETRSLTV